MRKLLIAISFFTRFPINIPDVDENEFYESMIMMPIVGLIVGIILGACAWGLSYINLPQVSAIVLIIVYIAVTGGLHFDGVADTVDGIFSARDHKRMMEIMKDSRLGSFGAIGLILLFLTLYSAYGGLVSNHWQYFVVIPLVGRTCAIESCCFTHYANGGGGLGRRIIEITKPWHVVIYAALACACAWLLTGWTGMTAVIVTLIVNLFMMHGLTKKIGGFTGDTIGLTIEVNQAFFAVIACLLIQNWQVIEGIVA